LRCSDFLLVRIEFSGALLRVTDDGFDQSQRESHDKQGIDGIHCAVPIEICGGDLLETGSPTDNDVVFSVENVTAAPGTDVSVAFNIEGEYESHALTAFVRYDTNMLSVVGNGIAQGNIWQNMIAGGGTIVDDAVTRPGQVPFMAIMPTNPFSGSGTIFTMNFHVNESVELGTVIPLELEIREFYYMPVQQTSPTLIPFTSDNGSITACIPRR